jgi:hypothetical protein
LLGREGHNIYRHVLRRRVQIRGLFSGKR